MWIVLSRALFPRHTFGPTHSRFATAALAFCDALRHLRRDAWRDARRGAWRAARHTRHRGSACSQAKYQQGNHQHFLVHSGPLLCTVSPVRANGRRRRLQAKNVNRAVSAPCQRVWIS